MRPIHFPRPLPRGLRADLFQAERPASGVSASHFGARRRFCQRPKMDTRVGAMRRRHDGGAQLEQHPPVEDRHWYVARPPLRPRHRGHTVRLQGLSRPQPSWGSVQQEIGRRTSRRRARERRSGSAKRRARRCCPEIVSSRSCTAARRAVRSPSGDTCLLPRTMQAHNLPDAG